VGGRATREAARRDRRSCCRSTSPTQALLQAAQRDEFDPGPIHAWINTALTAALARVERERRRTSAVSHDPWRIWVPRALFAVRITC
jgi:hypothetical protein